jgi:Holliday junction resolvase RusA-like endonuclease
MMRMLIALAPIFMSDCNIQENMGEGGMVRFRVQADPVAQGRPRLTTIGGMARAFDPKKSREWKSFIKDVALKSMEDAGHTKPLQGPLCARIRFGFALPKSAHRKRRPVGRSWHTKRPDIDNLIKGIFDACESVIYINDTCIAKVVVDKIECAQGEAPFVSVLFQQMDSFTGA